MDPQALRGDPTVINLDYLYSLRSTPNELYKLPRWITVQEAEVLNDLLWKEQPDIYFESGTANGFSACVAAEAIGWKAPIPNIHTWDPVDRPKIWEDPQLVNAKLSIVFHNEPFDQGVQRVLRDGKTVFFIDGDHRWHVAREDIRGVLAVAQPGDVLLLHDVSEDYGGLIGRFRAFEETHRTQFFPTERGMGAVWL